MPTTTTTAATKTTRGARRAGSKVATAAPRVCAARPATAAVAGRTRTAVRTGARAAAARTGATGARGRSPKAAARETESVTDPGFFDMDSVIVLEDEKDCHNSHTTVSLTHDCIRVAVEGHSDLSLMSLFTGALKRESFEKEIPLAEGSELVFETCTAVDHSEAHCTDEGCNYLGGGAFGAVWSGHLVNASSEPPVPVAVKVLSGDGYDEEAATMELTVMAMFLRPDWGDVCPYLLMPLGAWATDRQAVFVTQECWGSLADLIDYAASGAEPYSVRDAACLMHEAAVALDFIHKFGATHCDVKPENIMVVKQDGEQRFSARLGDFGNVTASFRSGSQAPNGTLGYEPPEQFNKEYAEAYPRRTGWDGPGPVTGEPAKLETSFDVFAYGVTCLEAFCLTRRGAHPDPLGNLQQALRLGATLQHTKKQKTSDVAKYWEAVVQPALGGKAGVGKKVLALVAGCLGPARGRPTMIAAAQTFEKAMASCPTESFLGKIDGDGRRNARFKSTSTQARRTMLTVCVPGSGENEKQHHDAQQQQMIAQLSLQPSPISSSSSVTLLNDNIVPPVEGVHATATGAGDPDELAGRLGAAALAAP